MLVINYNVNIQVVKTDEKEGSDDETKVEETEENEEDGVDAEIAELQVFITIILICTNICFSLDILYELWHQS